MRWTAATAAVDGARLGVMQNLVEQRALSHLADERYSARTGGLSGGVPQARQDPDADARNHLI
jgi:hypothetical protein